MLAATTESIVYLVGCAVNDEQPAAARIAQMDLRAVYVLSLQQALQALVYVALRRAYDGTLPQSALFAQWQTRYEAATARSRMVSDEMAQLLAFLEENAIWHMPVQGTLLERLYPLPETRQMLDRDILCDSDGRRQIRRYLERRGYKTIVAGGEVDIYTKRPFYNFEMHVSLPGYSPGTNWEAYYKDVRTRLRRDDGTRYAYHFSDEDFYVHLITHGCKHYRNEGNGLRLLIDIYVYLKAKGEALDWAYISGELATLAVADFEERVRTLCQRLFACPQEFAVAALTPDEAAFLDTFMENGFYGDVESLVRNNVRNATLWGKARYLWRRLFPEAELFRHNYPYFYHHRWLLPAGYVYRLAHRLHGSRHRVWREVRALWRL